MVPNALLLLSLLAASANGAHGGATHRQRRATRVPRIGNAAGQICRTRPSAESGRTFQRLAAEGGGYSACTKEDAYAYIHAHQDNGSGSGAAQASIAPSTSSEQPVASAAADTKAPTDIYTDPDNINRVPVNNIKFNAPAVTVNSGAGLTPNGIKAGISAGDAYDAVKDHIGWWYDWSPNPPSRGAPIAVPMLWGAGTVDHTDWQRYEDFKKLGGNPPYIIGFEEPDCAAGGGSAGMDVDTAARVWNELMAPWAGRTVLISPSMCHQYAETYLEPFFSKIDSSAVQVINVHINKKSGDEVRVGAVWVADAEINRLLLQQVW